jgi:opacity protein-like surface antigen
LILDYRSQIHAIGSGAANCFTNVTNPPPQGNPVPATCIGHSDSEIRRWDLLANGYLDLGTWDGFTPYIGAGAGVT